MHKKIINGLKLLRNVVGVRIGRPHPIVAVWESTYKCNMNCCFCNEKNLVTEEIKTEEVLNMIRQLVKLKTNIILLTGGEPTLRKDIDVIMEAIKKSGMVSIFTTNGFTIKNHLKTLTKADMIRISVDGYGDVHDQIRGTLGAFNKISEGVPLLVKAGKPPMLVTVVTNKTNRQNLHQLLRQARDWKVQVDLSMVTYSKRTELFSEDESRISQNQKESRISEENFLDLLDEFRCTYPDIVANPRFYRKLITSGGLGKKCRAMDVSLNIKPDGKVSIPCDAFSLLQLDGSLQEIWEKMRQLNDIKEKLGEYKFCTACYKRCIAFPSMLLSSKNLIDLLTAYLPTIKK